MHVGIEKEIQHSEPISQIRNKFLIRVEGSVALLVKQRFKSTQI